MASELQWTVFLGLLLMVSGTMGAAPRKPVNVPFGRNYAPTWAFDHIKYFNGGSDIQLHLDKYTGCFLHLSLCVSLSFILVLLLIHVVLLLLLWFWEKGTGFQSKGSYLFGHFSMQIKMVPGDSAGTVTAFYVSDI